MSSRFSAVRTFAESNSEPTGTASKKRKITTGHGKGKYRSGGNGKEHGKRRKAEGGRESRGIGRGGGRDRSVREGKGRERREREGKERKEKEWRREGKGKNS